MEIAVVIKRVSTWNESGPNKSQPALNVSKSPSVDCLLLEKPINCRVEAAVTREDAPSSLVAIVQFHARKTIKRLKSMCESCVHMTSMRVKFDYEHKATYQPFINIACLF